MILKLLLIIAVLAVVYILFFKPKTITNNSNKYTRKDNSTKKVDNDMVECATCSLYVEIHEAILSNGKYYCSQECLQKA